MAATVEKKVQPGKTDPFGTGKILVTDCLDKFSQHAVGPLPVVAPLWAGPYQCDAAIWDAPASRVQRVSLPEAGSVAGNGPRGTCAAKARTPCSRKGSSSGARAAAASNTA